MTSKLDLSGRVALVTGAAGGIGLAVAHAFAREGARVVMADRDAAAVAAAARLVGDRAEPEILDVTEEEAVTACVAAITARHGRIDVLVNNAGVSIRKGISDLSLADWERTFSVNATGAFLCTRAVVPAMRERGAGSIVNVASIMALRPGGPYPNPAYQASKAALISLTRSLAVELAPSGIRVNAVAPTWVRTAFIGALSQEQLERVGALTPLGRLAEAEEVADAVLFLAGPMAGMTTGHALAVDGGYGVG